MYKYMLINVAPEVLAAAMGDEGVLDISKASSAGTNPDEIQIAHGSANYVHKGEAANDGEEQWV